MRGYVPTPAGIADHMVDLLFRGRKVTPETTLLDPGCGEGALIQSVIRCCKSTNLSVPQIVGLDSDPNRLAVASRCLHSEPTVSLRRSDFLTPSSDRFDLVIANPPYVPITRLDEAEKDRYRTRYGTAKGRFDLYFLFMEQALEMLRAGGRAVFISPEKFIYTWGASSLRRLLSQQHVLHIELIDDQAFPRLNTYPTVTVVESKPSDETNIVLRDRSERRVCLPADGSSWAPCLWSGPSIPRSEFTLNDLSERISCGTATGADDVFVHSTAELTGALGSYAVPTVSGRELNDWNGRRRPISSSILWPYRSDGSLLPEDGRRALFKFLSEPSRKERLLQRSCVPRKPWYAFHENPPPESLGRKILWQDLTDSPQFWLDRKGGVLPRHSVYYLLAKDGVDLDALLQYLNSAPATSWMRAHCQRALNGYLRLQSRVMKRLPVPAHLCETTGN